jgi:hypothetical protein
MTDKRTDNMRGCIYLWRKIKDNFYIVTDEFGERYEDIENNVIDKYGNILMDRKTFIEQLIEKQKIEKENFEPIVNLIGLSEFIENPNTEWILSEYLHLEKTHILQLYGSLAGFKQKIQGVLLSGNCRQLYLYARTETATVQICCFNNFNQLPEVIKFLMTTNWIHSTLNIF